MGVSDPERSVETVNAVVEAFQSLPTDLQDVCRKLIEGTESSAARELGTSRRRVRNAVAEIRRRLTAKGLGES
jgi:phenylalanyl-tRNA synthetase beta subunit